jgi:hypothetical protein
MRERIGEIAALYRATLKSAFINAPNVVAEPAEAPRLSW